MEDSQLATSSGVPTATISPPFANTLYKGIASAADADDTYFNCIHRVHSFDFGFLKLSVESFVVLIIAQNGGDVNVFFEICEI